MGNVVGAGSAFWLIRPWDFRTKKVHIANRAQRPLLAMAQWDYAARHFRETLDQYDLRQVGWRRRL